MFDKIKCNSIFTIKSGTTPDTKEPSFYFPEEVNWLNSGDFHNSIINETKKKISFKAKNICGLKEFKPNSIVIAMYGANIGEVGFLNIKTTVNQACAVLKTKNSKLVNPKYYFYWFIQHKEQFILESYGGGQDNINQKIIAKTYIDLPTLAQQESIVSYLDKETSKIDHKISILEQKFEKLEEYKQSVIFETVTKGLDSNVAMKDSGIDWIGDIPAHWEVKRVKDVSKIKKGKAVETFLEQSEEMLPCIDTNFLRGRDNVVFCKNGTKVSSEKVLILWDGANAGELFFNKDIGYLGSTFGVFNTKVNNQFWFYYLKGIEQYSRDNLTGMGIPHVDGNVLKQTIAIIPSINEQIPIVNFLNAKTYKIDKKKEIIKRQIELLKELKQTIIYEAVTGKNYK